MKKDIHKKTLLKNSKKQPTLQQAFLQTDGGSGGSDHDDAEFFDCDSSGPAIDTTETAQVHGDMADSDDDEVFEPVKSRARFKYSPQQQRHIDYVKGCIDDAGYLNGKPRKGCTWLKRLSRLFFDSKTQGKAAESKEPPTTMSSAEEIRSGLWVDGGLVREPVNPQFSDQPLEPEHFCTLGVIPIVPEVTHNGLYAGSMLGRCCNALDYSEGAPQAPWYAA